MSLGIDAPYVRKQSQCQKEPHMPTPEELYQRGLSLGSEGKRDEAYRCYLEAAERGHAKA